MTTAESEEVTTEDEVGEALRRAGQPSDADVAGLDLDAGFSALLGEVYADVRSDAAVANGSMAYIAATRRRRVRKSIVVVAAAGALLGGAGAAAAAVYHAHTGQYGAPGMTENDTSEYLDAGAPDFAAVVRKLSQGYPFAPPYTREQFVQALAARRSPDGTGYLVQVTGVKGNMASLAFATWEVAWLRADAANDVVGRATAVTMMRAIAGWSISAQTNSAVYEKQLTDAAERGDRAPLVQDQTANPLDPPASAK